MAKTLTQKLFIKPGMSLAVLNAPEGYVQTAWQDLPEDVIIHDALNESYDQVHLFATHEAPLLAQVEDVKAHLKEWGVLWVCYPKGGEKAAVPTDLNRDSLWASLKPHHLAPNHQIAIDAVWSGLRFKVVE